MPFFQRVFSANDPCALVTVAPGEVLVLCSATSSSQKEGGVALYVILKDRPHRVQLGWINDDGNLQLTHNFTHEDGEIYFEVDKQRMRPIRTTVTGYTMKLGHHTGGSSNSNSSSNSSNSSSSSSGMNRGRETKRSKSGEGHYGRGEHDHVDSMRNTKVAKRDLNPHEQITCINSYKKLAQQIRGSTLNDIIDGTIDLPENFVSVATCANSIFKGIWKGDFPQPNAVENRKWTVKSQGLMYIDEVSGDGQEPKDGSIVRINYLAFLADGELFDGKINPKTPLTFRKGIKQVIQGLDKGLSGMKSGGQRTIVIPPNLAYGSDGFMETKDNGVTVHIPSDQTLIFKVALL